MSVGGVTVVVAPIVPPVIAVTPTPTLGGNTSVPLASGLVVTSSFLTANTLLADPPVVGLSLARSLGFIVVGRLADRFGIEVNLVSGRDTGVTACVRLPAALLGAGSSIVDRSVAAAAEAVATSDPQRCPWGHQPEKICDVVRSPVTPAPGRGL